ERGAGGWPGGGGGELGCPEGRAAPAPRVRAAAGRFGERLGSACPAAYVGSEGSGSGNGVAGDWPAMFGLTRSDPHLLPPPSPAQTGATLRLWQRLSLGARALTLIDTSAAMAAGARPGGPELEQLPARGAGDGLAPVPRR